MKRILVCIMALVVAVALIGGCSTSTTTTTTTTSDKKETADTGTLQFKANGEDFVRQGFTSKDGWNISFDHVYITLANITGYQTDPPYDPDKGGLPQGKQKASLPGTFTVDLAEGDGNALPILVGEVKDAPAGQYNAQQFDMVNASEGAAKGYALVIIGKAQKEGQTLEFSISSDQQYRFAGGEYVGDERKGILSAGKTADLEMTFHFDHIFGDMETPAEDGLNTGALGFEPFAALAKDGKINVSNLKTDLDDASYKKLLEILPTLGHIGEGHCHCEAL